MGSNLAVSLYLADIRGIGPKTYVDLVNHFGSAEQVFAASRSQLQETRLNANIINQIIKGPQPAAFDRELAWSKQSRQHIVAYASEHYPAQLAEIPDPPPHLYIKGDLDIISRPQLGMVGSRNPTVTGRETARNFARAISRDGLVITSGLAAGIDYECHKGALDVSRATIAVAGTGLDIVYPSRHTEIAQEITENGAMVSEFPLGCQPAARNFPKRNRIISGLSVGVLVVEATQKSGSLITARMANEQGRDVFAIPGSIHSPQSKGCHSLIKQGAKLVECTDDIFSELSLFEAVSPSQAELFPSPNSDTPNNQAHHVLLEFIGFESTSIDTIIERSGIDASKVSTFVTLLELDGRISAAPGGGYMKTN